MNFAMIFYILGWILNFNAIFLVLPLVTAWIYQEQAWISFAASIVISLTAGLCIIHRKPRKKTLYAKEGFIIVAVTWIVLSIFWSFPYILISPEWRYQPMKPMASVPRGSSCNHSFLQLGLPRRGPPGCFRFLLVDSTGEGPTPAAASTMAFPPFDCVQMIGNFFAGMCTFSQAGFAGKIFTENIDTQRFSW